MPELPDVEIFKQYLDATALHQEIETVEVRDDILLDGLPVQKLQTGLEGHAFAAAKRHGKHLFVDIEHGAWLGLHFGMTGHLKYFKKTDKEPDYSQALFSFANDYHLAYVAPRKLGKIELVENIDTYLAKNELGPDVLSSDFTLADFKEIMTGSQAMVKSALMTQEKMAGVGNVYSDEILFQAGLHPKTRHSPRNRFVAETLNEGGLATLLIDLLTAEEETFDQRTRELRFDIGMLTRRLVGATDWLNQHPDTQPLNIGYFGSSTGAAAALLAAPERPDLIRAVVSRGGRPDLAERALAQVQSPTLLIVGGKDTVVIKMNQTALQQLQTEAELKIIPGATHLFQEPGALEEVAQLARAWFQQHLGGQ